MADEAFDPLIGLMDLVADAVDWIHDNFSRELRRDLGLDHVGDPQRELPTGEKIRMRHPNGEPVDVDKEALKATIAEVQLVLGLLVDFLRSAGLDAQTAWESVGLLLQIGAADSIRAHGERGQLVHGLARALGFLHGLGSDEEVEALDTFRALDLLAGRDPRWDPTDPSLAQGISNWLATLAPILATVLLSHRVRASFGYESDPDSKTPQLDTVASTAFTLDVSNRRDGAGADEHLGLTWIHVPAKHPVLASETPGSRTHIAIGGGISYARGRFTALLEAPAEANIMIAPWDFDAGDTVRGAAAYGRSDAKALVFGQTDGPHLAVDTIQLLLDVSPTSSLRLEFKGIELSLAMSDADNLIKRLSQELKARFDLALVFDREGLRFEGGPKRAPTPGPAPPQPSLRRPIDPAVAPTALTTGTASAHDSAAAIGLRASVPAQVTHFGPFRIRTGHVFIGPSADATRQASIELALSADTDLGPFRLVVDRVGMSLDLRAGGVDPNLGLLDLDFGFKPPTGVGLSIDTPAVSGGGFLSLDRYAGRYAGAFELTLAGRVSVKGIAVISTRPPDGRDGFALLIFITAEGFSPIQLGMGFTLTGIGGLLALNRTVDADAVSGGLSDGVLDSILFAKDPIANAERLLTTLDRVFPVAQDRLVVGPLAEISWGTPPLLKLRAALLLELPQPIRATLLAALSVTLPRRRGAVVELNVDAIGILDLGRRELSLDAGLHHSRLLQWALTGEMALRLNWGSDPTFVLSVGGFHPRFSPPRGLRPLKRLALTLTEGANPRVRLEAYLALTSNTLQFGAAVTLSAAKGGFGIEGRGSFDALVQWSPFAIDVGFAAWARIFSPAGTLLAASVAVNVTGPRPWHVSGQATVQVLFFSFTVGIDLYLGEAAQPEPVETVDVAALLWEQVSDRDNWEAILPPAQTPGVTLAVSDLELDGAPVVAHPLSVISVRQRIVPLRTPISRVGAAVPTQGTRAYDLDVSVPLAGLRTSVVEELFAPGQYSHIPDDARLAQPSFARMPAGVSVRATTASAAGPALSCELAVETLEVSDLDDRAARGTPVAAVSA